MIKVKLGEILDVKRGVSLSSKYYSEQGNRIRLTLGNFNYPGGGFKENTSKTDIFFKGEVRADCILKKGDIITPLTEQVAGLLGETAMIPEDNTYIQSGDIGLVIPKEDVLNKFFAYYLISSPIVKKQLGAAAQQTKIRHTSPEKIKDCTVWLPEIQNQKRIAALLNLINYKIELNNRINSDLEEVIKTLYSYWFLQFDFPDKSGNPYKSGGGQMVWNDEIQRNIPSGWRIMLLSEFSNNYDSERIPLSNRQREKIQGEYPYFGATSIMDHINKYIFDGEYLLVAEDGSIEDDNGHIITQYIWGKTWVNNHAHVIQAKDPYNNEYLYQSLKTIPAVQITTGSVQKKINQENLNNVNIIYPGENLLKKYSNLITPLRQKLITNTKECNNLIFLRDWLLPMLMNGQICVTD